MVCKKCQYISEQVMCQGCSEEIEESCENGECEADHILETGSVNGHQIPPYKDEGGENI